jgi:hypothetical protein
MVLFNGPPGNRLAVRIGRRSNGVDCNKAFVWPRRGAEPRANPNCRRDCKRAAEDFEAIHGVRGTFRASLFQVTAVAPQSINACRPCSSGMPCPIAAHSEKLRQLVCRASVPQRAVFGVNGAPRADHERQQRVESGRSRTISLSTVARGIQWAAGRLSRQSRR